MTEQERQVPEEVLIHEIYSASIDLLEKYGKRDRSKAEIKTFFCDNKDERGYSDIRFKTTTTEGFNGPVTISVTSNENQKEITKTFTLHNFRVIQHIELEKDKKTGLIERKYMGELDKSRTHLDVLYMQLREAEINLESGEKGAACEDEKPQRFISLPQGYKRF